MHDVFRRAGRSLLLLPLALAALAGCQDHELPTGISPVLGGPVFSQAAGSPVVNSLLDDGTGCTAAKCTLRDAIAHASAGATITFDPALTAGGPAVIGLTAGQLYIDRDVTVAGPGANVLQVTRTAGIFRIFAIAEGSTVNISGLAIVDGRAFWGGGINNAGTLTLTDATVANNRASDGNTNENGGGIYNTGTLTISHSVLAGNNANAGGAIVNIGSLTMTNSTISGNTATSGAGIHSSGTLTVSHSTIAGNSSSFNGGGIAGAATVRNTILAANNPQNCSGAITDAGYNLDAGTSCGFTGTGSMEGSDPMLGALQDNSGPTWTRALLSGSPAIDAGSCTDLLGASVTTDQRGFSRPAGSACDIGAFEYAASLQPPPPTCEGVQMRMTRTAGPAAVAPGASGAWTVELEVRACEATTQVSAQGGTVSWATTSAATSVGTIGVRKANRNNEVLLWEIGAMAAGDIATAVLTVVGTLDSKAACGTRISIASAWSPTATAGGARVQYDAAGPVTVEVCPPPTAAAPSAADDEYSLTAGETLTVLAASGLLANDAPGSPAATITALVGADGEVLGDRTILEGTVAVDPATGAFTLTGATRAGTESFQYDITNSEGTSRGSVTITVHPAAAASMLAYAGSGQFGAPGATLPIAPAVRVTDAWDNAIAATAVAFAVTGGGGSATGVLATTTSEGIAVAGSWTLGAEAGVNTLQATSTGLASEVFTATAVTGCTGGAAATAFFSAFSEPVRNTLELTDTRSVTLLVTDACGMPVSDEAVTWAATGNPFSNGDGVTGGAMTGPDGEATASWTSHYTCGTRTVSATVAGLPAVQHTLNFGSCSGGGTPIRR